MRQLFNNHLFLGFLGLLCAHATFAKAFDDSKIIEKIENIRAQHGVAAATVILVRSDQVLIKRNLGVADWGSKKPLSEASIFRIGSISKAYAGILALRLEARGMIKLTDDVRDYGLSPYLKNTFPKQAITLAQLLEHTAGLTDLSKAEWDYNEASVSNLKSRFELKLGNHQTVWPPGMHSSYSNVGPGLFGLALENKFGVSYETLMQQHVLGPLRMQNTNLLLTDAVKKNLMTGYDRDGKTQIPYWHNVYRPFAAINTNNHDMVIWLQMLLHDGHPFLSSLQKKRLGTPTTTLAASHGLTYGYGLGSYQWQVNGHSFWGHGGDADGYLSRYGVNPESGMAYFVMINAFNHQPLNAMVDLLENHIVKDLPKPDYPLRIQLPSAVLDSYVGSYQPVTKRFGRLPKNPSRTLEITQADNQLYYRYQSGCKRNLYAVNQNTFRFSHHSTATMGFFQHGGKMYFQGDAGNFIQVD